MEQASLSCSLTTNSSSANLVLPGSRPSALPLAAGRCGRRLRDERADSSSSLVYFAFHNCSHLSCSKCFPHDGCNYQKTLFQTAAESGSAQRIEFPAPLFTWPLLCFARRAFISIHLQAVNRWNHIRSPVCWAVDHGEVKWAKVDRGFVFIRMFPGSYSGFKVSTSYEVYTDRPLKQTWTSEPDECSSAAEREHVRGRSGGSVARSPAPPVRP